MQCTREESLWNVSSGCFFRSLPIFCDGKNYSPPWLISIGSICKMGAGMREAVGAESSGTQPLAAKTCQSTLIYRQGRKMGGYPSEGDSSFILTENSGRCYPVLFLPSSGRYAAQIWKERQKRRACQIRTSYSDVVVGQKEVGCRTRSACLPGKINRPSLFGVTQKDTWDTPLVSAEAAYYGLSSWLPPALRLMICTVLCQCIFTWSLRPVILLSTYCACCRLNPHGPCMGTLWRRVTRQRGFICWDP